MSLSERIRPNCEAAPWVIDEVKRLEFELAEAYAELRKQRPTIKAVFDRVVWERAKNANPNAELTGAARLYRAASHTSDGLYGWR